MIGSLVGFSQKNKVADVMISVNSALWHLLDRGIYSVVIVVHPETVEYYQQVFHEEVTKQVPPKLEVGDLMVSFSVPKNHIWFCDKESIKGDGRVQSYDRKPVDSTGGPV